MQTDVVTWDEILQEPREEVNSLAPVTEVTNAILLASASQAQNQLQKASRACHREMRIGANELDDRFQFSIDDDIWRIRKIVRLDDDENVLGKITAVSMNQIRTMQRGSVGGPLKAYEGVNVHTSAPHAMAFDKRTLYFASGFASDEDILLDYDPFLLPYSARRGLIGGDWEGCDGENIGEWVLDHGPETEFWTELDGMKGFVGMTLLQRLGSSFVKMNYGAYLRFKSSWEEALLNCGSRQTNNTANDAAPSYGGPVL